MSIAPLIPKYKLYFTNKDFLLSSIFAALFLLASTMINYYAGLYATREASNSVTDIILSNTRVFDVDGIFVYGTIFFWIFICLLCLREPQKIPFTLKSIALFVVIRSIFISLTHIGPYPAQMIFTSDILHKFVFGGDLFFSGHTGLPFLMGLIFWERTALRFFFIASSIIFGIIVLMAHLHYSIDVLAAFFITYTIYRLAEIFFKQDKKIFNSGLSE